MKAVVAAFNQEKALVGAFSVLTNLRMELFQALIATPQLSSAQPLELNLSIVVHLLIFCGTFVPPSADCAVVVVVLAVSMRPSVR